MVHVYWEPPGDKRRPCRGAKLVGVEAVELHPFLSKAVNVRGDRLIVVEADVGVTNCRDIVGCTRACVRAGESGRERGEERGERGWSGSKKNVIAANAWENRGLKAN